ncbi:MAG: rhombosortase [Kiritimatiellaeota bacterium]|nr:rhombosortase [Kiritimatiellota bacterium]
MTSSPTKRDGGGDTGLPVISVAVVVAAVLVQACPGLPAALQFERSAIGQGQWWRVLTGHLAHWSWGHLFWDLAGFAILGFLCERRSRRRFTVCLFVSSVCISAVFHLWHPELAAYRGLSGVDSALFGLALTAFWREARRRGDSLGQWLFGAGALLFCAKIAYEIGARDFVFASDPDGRMTPVPVVHAVGFLIGIACALGASPCALGGEEREKAAPLILCKFH